MRTKFILALAMLCAAATLASAQQDAASSAGEGKAVLRRVRKRKMINLAGNGEAAGSNGLRLRRKKIRPAMRETPKVASAHGKTKD